MKTIRIKSCFIVLLMLGFTACKKEVYPEELQFLVVDTYSKKPIANAKVQLFKVWRHAYKIGNNAKKDAWFADYGRKEIYENQVGFTDKNGKVNFTQEHRKYLCIVPGVFADGYQMNNPDTLDKFRKKNADDAVYTIEVAPKVKTTFIFKSITAGWDSDSVVFSSNEKKLVMKGAQIDNKLEVYTNQYADEKCMVWYGGTISRKGKKVTLCSYVYSYPNKNNEFVIDVDL